MPRVRAATAHRAHDRLGDAAVDWVPAEDPSPLQAYAVRHGVAHLLGSDRREEAEGRLLDLAFMAAFVDAWDTVVEPLAAWRVLDPTLERARAGYKGCLLYTSPSPRDKRQSRMPSSA